MLQSFAVGEKNPVENEIDVIRNKKRLHLTDNGWLFMKGGRFSRCPVLQRLCIVRKSPHLCLLCSARDLDLRKGSRVTVEDLGHLLVHTGTQTKRRQKAQRGLEIRTRMLAKSSFLPPNKSNVRYP